MEDRQDLEQFDHPDASLSMTIVASHRQLGNKMLNGIKDLRIIYANIVPDYLLSLTNCVIFISLAYHRLHPDYLPYRIQRIHMRYRVRILLCLVDLEDSDSTLANVTYIAFQNSMSLYLAWSNNEAAKVLRIFKQWGEKPPDIIQSKLDSSNSKDRCIEVLTTIPAINKVDSVTLMKEFRTIKNLILAEKEDIRKCQGIGAKKIRQLWKVFHEPLGKPGDLA